MTAYRTMKLCANTIAQVEREILLSKEDYAREIAQRSRTAAELEPAQPERYTSHPAIPFPPAHPDTTKDSDTIRGFATTTILATLHATLHASMTTVLC